MPKEITHILFAEECINELSNKGLNKLSNILSKNKLSSFFGSTAVDLFYYNLKIPLIDRNFVQWGDTLHGAHGEDTSLPIIEMISYLKSHSKSKSFESKLSFIYGFLSHFSLDINFHPMVYYFSGNYYDKSKKEKTLAIMRHRLIESWFDLFFLKERNLEQKNFDKIKKAFDNNENLENIYFLSKSLNKAWNNEADLTKPLKRGYFIQRKLNQNFGNKKLRKVFEKVNKITNDKLITLFALFYPNEEKIPENIIGFKNYQHPVTGEILNYSLNDIWKNALKLHLEFSEAIENYLFNDYSKEYLKSIIKGYSLDVGMEGVPVNNVKYFSPLKIKP